MVIKDKITPQLKKRFRDEIQNTIKDGIEYGFNLCKDKKGNLFGTETCRGNKCGITLKNAICPLGSETQGNFHTHPDMPDIKFLLDLETIEDMKSYMRDVAKSEGISLVTPSNQDVFETLSDRCDKKIAGTVCVGSDLEDNKIECWTVKENISKIDCFKANIRKKFSISATHARKWTRDLFDIEEIDLRD